MSEEKMHPIEGLMDTTLEKIKQMVDVNTVIGTPITTADGTTVIPISKVVYGFASGGSEFQGKREGSSNLFGGGTGAGVTINPVAFLTISNGDVKLLNIADYKDGQDRAIGMVPEVIDKIVGLFKKDKKEEKSDKSADETPKAGIEDPII